MSVHHIPSLCWPTCTVSAQYLYTLRIASPCSISQQPHRHNHHIMWQVIRLSQACCVLLGLYLLKALWYLFKCWRARWNYGQLKIPGPPAASTILGHLSYFESGKGPWKLAELTNEYGPIVKLHLLDKVTVMLTDPDTIGRVLRKTGPGPYFPKANDFYTAMEKAVIPPVANILTSADGPYWKAVRQATAPCFSASNLKKVLPLVVELAKRAADKAATVTAAAAAAGSAPLFDVSDAAKRITSDVMGHLLLGEDLEGTKWGPSEYLQVLYPVLKAQAGVMENPWHFYHALWNKEVAFQWQSIKQHDDLIATRVKGFKESPPPEYTIAAHLLSVKDPATGKPLTINKLKGEVGTFMFAGFETTSHAITWCLAVLAAHQDIQQKLVDELVAEGLAPAVAPGVRDIEASDLGKLVYMSAVIKEVLRVCSPAPFGGNRTVTEDTDICGYTVPKGTFVLIVLLPVGLSHRNYGDSALDIRPDRWLSNCGKSVTNMDIGSNTDDPEVSAVTAPGQVPDPYTFLAGPRDCIGQALAKLELQVVLTTLLSRFKVLPGPRLQHELDVAAATGKPVLSAIHALASAIVTLQPVDGTMMLRLEPREGCS